ncbi:leucine-rich repeat extensin-like protein 3 [Iris pallida]|uniref:Leucine-rich repeat extensin-like protein 3 n=1 Tax=Iris pallida TaxID=29817 RepID=A0AAX6ICF9_IRIPA|nr:leucine-rich repeat extensin-like protein 3 [Iris pallida]
MLIQIARNGHKLDLFTYGILIHGMCEMGDLDGASRVYSEMIKTGGRVIWDCWVITCSTMSLTTWEHCVNHSRYFPSATSAVEFAMLPVVKDFNPKISTSPKATPLHSAYLCTWNFRILN